MTTSTRRMESPVGTDRDATGHRGLTSEAVWSEIEKASFAIVAYVTPTGEPRSSGVSYKSSGRRLYLAVDPDSWKAKHIAASQRVSVTVPVRRGGILTLMLPIPPATISFQATAVVGPASPINESPSLPKELASLLPVDSRTLVRVIELVPEGEFLTYGVGVSLMAMKQPHIAQSRVAVGQG
jgi:hypothetical protein